MPTGQLIGFDGQVAIVTGVAGSMGRCFAQMLAARGARVLVNDYGGNSSGNARSSDSTDAVVSEFTASGGHAVANSIPVGTMESARGIVNAALDRVREVVMTLEDGTHDSSHQGAETA